MNFVKGFALSVALVSGFVLPAQAAVSIDAAAIAEVQAACGGGDCSAALQTLIAQLQAANPTLSVKEIVAAIAAEIGDAANGALGTEVQAALAEALDSLGDIAAAAGLDIADVIEEMADAAAAGNEIDLTAVAAGDDQEEVTGAPDTSGSDS